MRPVANRSTYPMIRVQYYSAGPVKNLQVEVLLITWKVGQLEAVTTRHSTHLRSAGVAPASKSILVIPNITVSGNQRDT
jgi:hypothetical protein